MFATGQAAIKLAPTWMLEVNMFSHLDPDADFAGLGNPGLLEPVNPEILTQPAWDNFFLTPNASYPTPGDTEPEPATPTPIPVQPTQPPVVDTPVIRVSPTATLGGPVVIPTTTSGDQYADLAITKSDSSNTYTPGTTVSYTIVVTNNGPDGADGFNIVDNIPASITGLNVSCTASGGYCGSNTSSGNTVSFTDGGMLANAQLTITVSGLVSSGTVGNLSNTAMIQIPSESLIVDDDYTNNSATDIDTRFAISDLVITKTDNSNTYTATGPIIYTVTITNSGPSDAFGVRVEDAIPSQIASWDWLCTTELNASGCDEVVGSTANFVDNGLNIQVGGRIEYTVTAYMPANANTNTSSIANTASVLLPGGPNFIDPDLSNNSSTDTDIPYIDLQITKSDGGATFTPNGTLSYTVTVTNNSTFDLTGITVSDPKPTQLTNWTWTCVPVSPTCNGVTNSNTTFTDTIDLTANSSQVYNITANVSANPGTGDITNTATVNVPAGLVDAVPGNNSATETTPPFIDLQITKTDVPASATYTSGGNLTYQVTVTNNSGFTLNGVTVTDTTPTLITSWSWTCGSNPPPGPTCDVASGTGNIVNNTVNLPAGRSVTYTINATVNDFAAGPLANTASVSPPTGLVDTIPGNNSATDTNVNADGEPEVGTPDGDSYDIPEGSTATFFLSQPIVANGDGAADFVFYEFPAAPGIALDHVIIEISSTGLSSDWFRVFYWGDGTADTNTNVNINLPNIANACTPNSTEEDNCPIDSGDLYNNTGITINVDNSPLSAVPAGNYPWIRFIAPAGSGDAAQVDAIQILP
jgi:uncharacterized repeat protein (TIGR01451 family)